MKTTAVWVLSDLGMVPADVPPDTGLELLGPTRAASVLGPQMTQRVEGQRELAAAVDPTHCEPYVRAIYSRIERATRLLSS